MARPNLLQMTPEELASHLETVGVHDAVGDARRVLARVISDGRDEIDPTCGIRRDVRLAVNATTDPARLEVVERASDPADGFVKYLLRSPDGALSEAVRIPLRKAGRYTVCLSAQVGCAMGCDFCATGRLGLTRNLEAWEMVAAFRIVRSEAEGRPSGAVFMGQGEPFQNYDAVIRAADVLSNPCGGRIRGEAISISTVGLAPQIRRYTREGHRYRLICSLTSAIPSRRRSLVPVAGSASLQELADALAEHAAERRDRVTIAWVLLGGVNDGVDEVDALETLFDGVPMRINLIDVNDSRADGYRRATDTERDGFIDELQRLRVPVVRRYSGGVSRHAACGMLANRRIAHEEAGE